MKGKKFLVIIIQVALQKNLKKIPVYSVKGAQEKNKVEAEEMSILRDISQFMSKSGKNNDDIFAEYIGCEIKQSCDSNVKRLLKHRIQNEIFDAQTRKGITTATRAATVGELYYFILTAVTTDTAT